MADRQKVIKGLECCMIPSGGGCDDCPYVGKGICQELMGEDALALLKGQEPRVMTFDEVVGGDECWLDAINGVCGYADFYACIGTGDVQVFRCKYDNPQYVRARDYLKTWRCWTSKPDEKRRDEMPWDF